MKKAIAVCMVGGLVFGVMMGSRDFAATPWERVLMAGVAGAELAATILIARAIAMKSRER